MYVCIHIIYKYSGESLCRMQRDYYPLTLLFLRIIMDLVFVNNLSKVMLYDQISASVFSDHDRLFITYDHHINIQQEVYEYRDFKRIDYNFLLQQLEYIKWNKIYSYNDINDQMRFL